MTLTLSRSSQTRHSLRSLPLPVCGRQIENNPLPLPGANISLQVHEEEKAPLTFQCDTTLRGVFNLLCTNLTLCVCVCVCVSVCEERNTQLNKFLSFF